MSTGWLKLASLLIVITAGGGVAWQAQQGILHSKTDGEAADKSADDFADLELDSDDADLLASADPTEESPRKPSSWRDDDKPALTPPSEGARMASLPGKFERSSTKPKASPTTIPARTAAPAPRRNATPAELAADDPFNNSPTPAESEVAETESPTPLPDLGPLPDLTDTSEDATDTDSGVQLVSGTDEPPRRRRSPPSLDLPTEIPESANAPISDEADPFSDSAPPEFGDAPASDDSHKNSMPALDLTDDAPAGSDEFESEPPFNVIDQPTREPAVDNSDPFDAAEPVDMPKTDDSPREEIRPSRRREPAPTLEPSPALEPEPQPEVEEMPFTPNADPVPEIDTSTVPLPDLGRSRAEPPARRSRATSPTPAEPTRRTPTPRMPTLIEDEPNEAPKDTPRLLPSPSEPIETEGFGEMPSDDAPTIDLPQEPTLEPRTRRTAPQPKPDAADDLTGDATPNPSAPTGMQQPRLTIEKVAPKQAVLGEKLVYSVIVRNAGSADAHQVTVEDRIPKGTILDGTAPQAELVDKSLIWKLGTLKPNEERKISIRVVPQEQGPIGSVAKVNFVAEIAAEIEVTAPQINLAIDAPSQVRLGEKLKLVYKLRNTGKADAANVVLRNIVPEGLRHPAGADLEYAIGTLAAEDSRDITLELVATKNGKVTNKTIITADNGISVEEETPVEVIGEQLLLTRTGKNKLYVNREAVFTSTVANEGTAPAKKVMIAEIVPAGFEFVSASSQGKYDPATRAVTWTVGPIEPGEELKLSTQLMPKKLGDYRATITVTGPAGSVATVESDLKIDGFSALEVDSKSNTRLISIGEKATIRIACKNQGTAAARNTILSADLPPELKLVDGSGPVAWAQQGNRVTFEAVPNIGPGETVAFELQVEGAAEGETRIELQISSDQMKRPLHRDETLRVAPDAE